MTSAGGAGAGLLAVKVAGGAPLSRSVTVASSIESLTPPPPFAVMEKSSTASPSAAPETL